MPAYIAAARSVLPARMCGHEARDAVVGELARPAATTRRRCLTLGHMASHVVGAMAPYGGFAGPEVARDGAVGALQIARRVNGGIEASDAARRWHARIVRRGMQVGAGSDAVRHPDAM